MARKGAGTTQGILKEINSNVVRYNPLGNGIYEHAEFKVGSDSYRMDIDGNLIVKNKKGVSRHVVVNYGKRGIYPQVRIGVTYIKKYVLSMLCLTDDFYAKYVEGDCIVNHMVIVRDRYEYTYGDIYSFHPLREVDSDPRYLEAVTQSDNMIHANFVSAYGLFGVAVSAKDIPELRGVFRRAYDTAYELGVADKMDYPKLVEEYYRDKGETKQIIFNYREKVFNL